MFKKKTRNKLELKVLVKTQNIAVVYKSLRETRMEVRRKFKKMQETLTPVDVDDGVHELVAADLGIVVGPRTAHRALPADAVPTDGQTTVAQHR